MHTKPSWVRLSEAQRQELGDSIPSSGWKIVPGSQLPGVFPESFRQKLDSAMLICAPTSTGGVYLAYSALRSDHKSQKIDMEPFGVMVHSTGPSSSGVFLHHGDWDGRTEPPPDDFWNTTSRSGVGNYFFSNPPEGLREGALSQLPKGHSGAFEALIGTLRQRVNERKK